MTQQEALEVVSRIFARYPGSAATVDELVLAEWAEEFAERFAAYPADRILAAAREVCRHDTGRYVPSLGALCREIVGLLHRQEATHRARLRLVEPPPSDEERERAKAFFEELRQRIGAAKAVR